MPSLSALGPLSPQVMPVPWAPSDPYAAAARFLDLPAPLLLESATAGGRHGRWSFLAADPVLVLRGRGDRLELRRGGRVERRRADPFVALHLLLAEHPVRAAPGGPPFQGGAAGYFGYELGRVLERLPPPRSDDLRLPDVCVGFYDWVLAWDHGSGKVLLVTTGVPEPPGAARARRARRRAEEVLERLAANAATGHAPRRRAAGAAAPAMEPGAGASPGLEDGVLGAMPWVAPDPAAATFSVEALPGVASTFSREGYLAAVARIREYILAGDIFQANLSQRLEAPLEGTPFDLYGRLRRHNPAAFSAYFDPGECAVVSASPERFLRHVRGRVETRPIKGTAPRGGTARSDAALARALRRSEKDRAENVMIVDLLRNDLSAVCRDGSVRVAALCRVERHPTVHHLVSTVVGRLRPGLGAVDLLRAAFPGGSITGAPKVRAMEILCELEPTRRGVYTGAVGYIGWDGAMDTSVAIRTFVVKGGTAYFQAGGGVVVDSDPVREYEESLDKARGLAAALGPPGAGARLGGAAWSS